MKLWSSITTKLAAAYAVCLILGSSHPLWAESREQMQVLQQRGSLQFCFNIDDPLDRVHSDSSEALSKEDIIDSLIELISKKIEEIKALIDSIKIDPNRPAPMPDPNVENPVVKYK